MAYKALSQYLVSVSSLPTCPEVCKYSVFNHTFLICPNAFLSQHATQLSAEENTASSTSL